MLSRMRNSLLMAMIAASAFLFVAGRAYAQSTSATVSGTVKDPSGASVPSAKVTITNQATKGARTVDTNEAGIFVVPDIEQGVYDVSIEKAGFKKLIRSGVAVDPQDRLGLGDLTLQVGAPTDTITVVEDAGQLEMQTQSGERSEAVTNLQLRDIALNGRNINDLAKLVPGVAMPGGAAEISNLSAIGNYQINGMRVTMKDMSVDGSSITRTDQQAQQVTINPDAVGEINILTSNYQAEYGKAAGGIVTITTKNGTQDFQLRRQMVSSP